MRIEFKEITDHGPWRLVIAHPPTGEPLPGRGDMWHLNDESYEVKIRIWEPERVVVGLERA